MEDQDEAQKRYPVRESPMMHAAARTLVNALNALNGQESELSDADLCNAALSNKSAREAINRAIQFLVVGGARASDRLPNKPTADLCNTPAVERLFQTLHEAVDAAENVDAERGQILPEEYPLKLGETRGTGWAETLGELRLRLKSEMDGQHFA